jgi:hypothetical protein
MWLVVALVAGGWASARNAQADEDGTVGHSGKDGVTCTSCHYAYSRQVRVAVELLNQDLTAATQPLDPAGVYTFRVREQYAVPVAFRGGFNLAVGNLEAPGLVGQLLVRDLARTKVMAGEVTHVAEQTSAATSGGQQLEWLVDWIPPATGNLDGTPVALRVYAAVTKSNAVVTATEVRALSAVSATPNAAGAAECGPATVAGFDPTECGLPLSVLPYNCVDSDEDGFLPETCVVEPERGGGDCDDTRDSTFPGAAELCNERDDDCDLEVDEGFSAGGKVVGEECDSADEDMCLLGVVLCSVDGLSAACMETDTVAEVCGNLLDDDCDGTMDETVGLAWQGIPFGAPCDSAVDEDRCANGRVQCNNQRPACQGDIPTPEYCGNALDDDCDSATDEPGCLPVPDGGVPIVDSGFPPYEPDGGAEDGSAGSSGGGSGSGSGAASASAASGGGQPANPDGGTTCNCTAGTDSFPVHGMIVLMVVCVRRARKQPAAR